MTTTSVPAGCARRFRPERVLAEGGFGVVWYATQVDLSRPVALKLLHPQLVEEQVQVQRFLNEARITASLRHPNVVTLIDHGVEDGIPWIAYEFVPGESLRARLARGPLPWREACDVAGQVAAALEAAHAQGVLHRDIKPDNILSSELGHYKVADFGIAKVRTGQATLTARGEILGTPSYLSPVQIRGEAPGPDSDVYALGITLFELLTGQPPFVADSPIDTLTQHLTAEIPRASTRVPGIPHALDDLLVRMLAKKRSERMGNAGEVRIALAALAAQADDAPSAPPPAGLASGRTRRGAAPGRQTVVIPTDPDRPRGSDASADQSSAAPDRRAARPGVPNPRSAAGAPTDRLTAASRATIVSAAPGGASPDGALAPDHAVAPDRALAPDRGLAPDRSLAPDRGLAPDRAHAAARALAAARGLGAARATLALAALGTFVAFVCAALYLRQPAVLPPPPAAPASRASAAAPLPSFHVLPLARSVRVALVQSPGSRLAIELGHGEPPRWVPRVTLDGDGGFVAREIDGLEPDTAYHVRLRAPDGQGETASSLVRTLRDTDFRGRVRIAALAADTAEDRRIALMDLLPTLAADPGVTSALVGELAHPPPPDDVLLRAVADFGWQAPSRPLAEALLAASRGRPEDVRGKILGLACYTGVRGATEAALDFLASASSAPSLGDLYRGLAQVPGIRVFDQLQAAVLRIESDARFAPFALIAADPEAARALFERWLVTPPPEHPRVRGIAARGFALLPGARTAADLERLSHSTDAQVVAHLLQAVVYLRLTLDAPRIAAPLVGVVDDPTSRNLLALAGAPGVRARLLLGLRDSDRARSLTGLSYLPAGAMPVELLDQPDAADLTAFSYAGATDPAIHAALRARALSDRDASGIALWALARSGDRAGVPRVLRLLAEPARDPAASGRRALAAWIAGDLQLAEARPLLQQLATQPLEPFERASVRDALAWLAAGRAPLTFLMPAELPVLTTRIAVRRDEACYVRATALPTASTTATAFDVENVKVYFNPTVVWAGAGPWHTEVKPRTERIAFPAGGELSFTRTSSLHASLQDGIGGALLRIVVER